METNSKLMTAEEAVRRFVQDGDCMALGGFATNRKPYGLVREIIRQGKKDLTIESGSAGGDIDMLIGAGCVKVLNISYIANSGYSMVTRRFRKAVESGSLPIEDYSLDAHTIMYHAAALGLPYVAVKNMLGSDLEKVWGISEEERKKYPKLSPKKFIIQEDPFHPGERLALLPTPQIDVAIVHVQKASPEGIVRIEGPRFQDEDISMAAKRTIISCEELLTDEEMRSDPFANTLPGLVVDAVVHIPFGSHPSSCCNYYDYDPVMLKEYDAASKTDEGFEAFLKKVLQPTQEEYLAQLTQEQIEAIRVDPETGYATNLKR